MTAYVYICEVQIVFITECEVVDKNLEEYVPSCHLENYISLEECRLLGCYSLALVKAEVSEEPSASIITVTRNI
jgi:hypothetical protein